MFPAAKGWSQLQLAKAEDDALLMGAQPPACGVEWLVWPLSLLSLSLLSLLPLHLLSAAELATGTACAYDNTFPG
eukprot:COSAG03_NODE_430_length_7971_cov_9.753303_3_plen_75_part_00